MDVAGWGKAAYVPGPICILPGRDKALVGRVDPEKLFILDSLNYSEDAPGHVVVNRCDLSRAPDERDDGEGAVGLGMEHMTPKPCLVTLPLLGGEGSGWRKMALQL